MLTARSAPEAHLYMDLHPCDCGSGEFDRNHHMELDGNDLVAVYEGPCRQCGKNRRFTFRMAEEIPPPPPAFGGAQPSLIIDPGEFLHAASRYSESTGVQLLNLPRSERHTLRDAVAYTLALYEEIPKFIPTGQTSVPITCFTSELGKERYLREPGNFELGILERNIKNARNVLDIIDRSGQPPRPTT